MRYRFIKSKERWFLILIITYFYFCILYVTILVGGGFIKNKKFISLVSDTTFKYLFKNEDTRPFLEEVIRLSTGIDISGFSLVDNELSSGNYIKDYRLDIILKKDNNIISIEMNSSVTDSILLRNRRYLYRIAGNLLEKGMKYKDDKIIIKQINFNNCYCKQFKDLEIGIFSFREENHEELEINDIKIYDIYLSKFKDISYNDSNKLSLYLSMFHAKSIEEQRKISEKDEELFKVMAELERLSEDEKFAFFYDKEKADKVLKEDLYYEGLTKGRTQGKKDGMEEEKVNIAKSMLENNYSYEEIIKITGLTKKEIGKL